MPAIQIYLNETLDKALKEEAKKKHQSKTALALTIIEEEIARRQIATTPPCEESK